MSLRRKLLFVFLGLAVVPITLVGVVVAVVTLRIAERQARDGLLITMDALVDVTANDLDMRRKTLERTAAELTARFDRAGRRGWREPLSFPIPLAPGLTSPEIRVLRAGEADVESWVLADRAAGGSWEVERLPLGELPGIYGRLLGVGVDDPPLRRPILTDFHSTGAVLAIASVTHGPDGREAVLVVEYPALEYFDEALDRESVQGLTSAFVAIRTDGFESPRLVYDSDPTSIGLPVDESSLPPSVVATLRELHAAGRPDQTNTVDWRVLRVGDELFAVGVEPLTGFILGGSRSLVGPLTPIRGAVGTGLVLLALLVALIVSGVLYVTRGVGRAVEQIAETTASMAEGHFDRPLDLRRSDEFGVIAAHVNRLSEELLISAESRAIARISASLVHDLKGVASQLKLLLYNLRENPDDPEFRAECLGLMQDLVMQVEKLTMQLRRGDSQREVVLQEFDLDGLVMRLLDGPLVNTHRAIVVETDLRTPYAVRTDPAILEECLQNVITNAVEAVGDEGRLRVRTGSLDDDEGDGFFIEITDDGPGMSAEFLRTELFRPFVTTKAGGTGLGMYTVRELVTRLGGHVTVDSAEGEGATVRIELGGAA